VLELILSKIFKKYLEIENYKNYKIIKDYILKRILKGYYRET